MRKKLSFLTSIIVLCFMFMAGLNAQTVSHDVIYPTEFYVTKPLRDLAKEQPTIFRERDEENRESEDREGRVPQIFKYSVADGPQYGDDPLVRQIEMGKRKIESSKAVIQSWAGQTATSFRPFDPSGAVGPNYYIQMINSTTYKIFNKTNGASVLTGTLGNLWSPATANNGDPIVMYDQYADRWFLAQFGSSTDKKVYIAISKTGDPTGQYYTYTYTSSEFPDYLKFSIWENGYYMTSNTSGRVYCFERDQMLAGNSSARAVSATFTEPCASTWFFVPLPADAADGSLPAAGTPMPFVAYTDNAWGGGAVDGVVMWNMTVTWGTTATASISASTIIPVSAFDGSYNSSWNDIPQPGTTQKLDGIGGTPMYRAQWRPWGGYNTLVMNWPVQVSTSQRSIRWVELRQNQSTGVWSLYQESTYAPDADSRWMASIAMDDNGSIGMAYCKSSSSTYPTLCYTGRLASDPLGTMSFAETVAVSGTSVQTGTNRFGDYSQTSLDIDGLTFWHTGEYIASGVKTRIFSFIIPAPSIPPVADFSGTPTSLQAGNNVTYTDLSTNNPTSWSWSFPGGTPSTSSLQNPVITYNTPGTYNVSLTATNAAGNNTKTKNNYITVTANTNPPVANFSADNTAPCGGATVTFTDLSTGVPTSWSWSFSPSTVSYVGGTSSTSQNPKVVFNGAGPYSVTLTATNAYGNNSTTKTNYITPVALASLPFIENFESTTFPPTGWTNENADAPSVTWGTVGAKGIERRAAAGNSGSTSGCAGIEFFNYNTDTTQVDNLISMPVSLIDVSGAQMTFKRAYKYYNSSTSPNNYHDELKIYVSTDCGVTYGSALYFKKGVQLASNGTLNTTFTPSVAADWDTDTINLSAYANQSIKVKFEYINRWGNNLYIDDINISATSSVLVPVADFSANPIAAVCSGDVQFTDVSTNVPTSWLWNFGDGQTSTQQNPLHTYAANGTYTVTLTATNSAGSNQVIKTNYITVSMPVAPTATGNSRCGTGTVDLSATGSGVLHWFDAATGGNDLGTGTTFTTPSIATTTTFYVEDHALQPSQYVGPLTTFASGAYSNTAYTLTFDCYAACNLVSVAIDKSGAGNITIQLQDASSNVLQSGTFAVPDGASRVTLNWPLTPATGLKLVGPSNVNLWRVNTPGTFPYTLSGLISITGCSSTTRYGSFYDWEIKEPDCVSSRTSVVATVITPDVTAVSISANLNSVCVGTSVTFTATPTNGGTPSYQWQINSSNVGTNSNTFTTSSLADGDVVTCDMTSSLACVTSTTVTSNPVTMTINTPVAPTATGNSRCGAGTVSLTATGNGELHWFDAPSGGTDLGTGTTYTTPVISTTTTYYVEDRLIQPSQYVGPLTTFASGAYSNTAYTLTFDCYAACNLVSVAIDKSGAGNITIQLQDASSNVLQSGTFAVPDGASRVTLNWPLTPATGLKLVGPSNVNLWRVNTPGTFPYTLSGLISITGCSSTTRYGSFYDWEIQEPGCISERTPVAATIDSQVAPSVSISSATTTICSGTSVTFTATPTNGGTPAYQWKINGVNAGTNSNTFTSNTLIDGDLITCEMTSSLSCVTSSTATSNTITMSVTTSVTPSVAITATSTSICSGTSVTFTATPTNGGTPAYQWKLNGSNVGTGGSSFTSSSLANGDVITCEMTSSLTCVTNAIVTSNSLTMAVSATATPVVTIAADATTICSGTQVIFTATPTFGGTPSYQWYLNSSPVGSNSDSYSNNSLSNGDAVTCEMTSSLACATTSTVASNSVIINVSSNVTPSVSISSTATTICSGTQVTFTATPTNGGTPAYQWLLNGSNVGTGGNTFTVGTLTDGDIVTCEMTSSLTCATIPTVTSNSIMVAVTTTVSPAVVIGANESTICSGTSVTFTATPTNGGTPTYQWLLNGSIVGSGDSFTSSILANGDIINCEMTSSLTCVSSANVNSNSITMIVNPVVTPSVSITTSTTTICSGTSATFTATPVDGGTPTYQWLLNGSNVGTGGNLFTSDVLADGDVVSCVMTSSLSCTTTPTANSNTIAMAVSATVTPTIAITTEITDICDGASVTFTATPTNGGTPSYQWQVNGVNVGTDSNEFTSTSFVNGDVVTCDMTSSLSCTISPVVTSNAVTMNVTTVMVNAGIDRTICLGESVALSGSGATTYSWDNGVQDGVTFTPTAVGTTTYTVTGTTNGCVAIDQVDVTVNAVDNYTVTSNGPDVSVTPLTGASYQWIDCDNGNSIIPGETGTSYVATVTGNYSVEIDQNGCTSTSSCEYVDVTIIINSGDDNDISVYPNPTTGVVNMSFSKKLPGATIVIKNTLGQIVYKYNADISKGTVKMMDLGCFSNGVFFVHIINEDVNLTYKIIYEK